MIIERMLPWHAGACAPAQSAVFIRLLQENSVRPVYQGVINVLAVLGRAVAAAARGDDVRVRIMRDLSKFRAHKHVRSLSCLVWAPNCAAGDSLPF